MLVIPSDKFDEWDSEYDRLQLSKQISRMSFLAHCAATWGYDQGLTAMNQLFNIDPELE
jgi:hypothetical protein